MTNSELVITGHLLEVEASFSTREHHRNNRFLSPTNTFYTK